MTGDDVTPDERRIAAVDIGSNTTRLIVADVTRAADGSWHHEAIARATTITRLAEGVDARGILLPEPIARTRNALSAYRARARALGARFVLATATSAVRDADNGEAFLGEVEHSYGFRAMLLDGDAEATATWRGVTSDPALARRAAHGSGWLLDIGGGSTEVVIAVDGAIVDRHSFQMGSVRLTEQMLSESDPPTAEQMVRARAHAMELLATRFPNPSMPDTAIGVAGTVTTVSTLALGLEQWNRERVHLSSLTPADVESCIVRLAAIDADARAHIPGLEPGRAPVILGGLCILAAALEHFSIASLTVSDCDILDGIALMAGQIAIEEDLRELPEAFGRASC